MVASVNCREVDQFFRGVASLNIYGLLIWPACRGLSLTFDVLIGLGMLFTGDTRVDMRIERVRDGSLFVWLARSDNRSGFL